MKDPKNSDITLFSITNRSPRGENEIVLHAITEEDLDCALQRIGIEPTKAKKLDFIENAWDWELGTAFMAAFKAKVALYAEEKGWISEQSKKPENK